MWRQRLTHHLRPALPLALVALVTLGAAPQADPEAASDQPAETADPWAPLELLVGTWEGQIEGKLGTGRGVRHYELIMKDKYLLARHRSVRLPQEKSPEGDQHEELAVFSWDSERETLVLREFMIEGVVVRSTCQVEGMTIICTSEAVESGPGIRARLTLEIEDRYRFTEIYELGWPGRELEHYFTNRWTRTAMPSGWE